MNRLRKFTLPLLLALTMGLAAHAQTNSFPSELVGLDANLPASCSAPQQYYATDSAVKYECSGAMHAPGAWVVVPTAKYTPLRISALTANHYGDSYTSCTQASSTAKCWVNVLDTAMGWTPNNLGFGGSVLEDSTQYGTIVNTATSATTVSTLLTGFNDERYGGTDPNWQKDYTQTIYGALAWMALPPANKVTHTSGSLTYGGAWTTNTAWTTGVTYHQTTAASATVSGNLSGEVIYVSGVSPIGALATYTVTVDGLVNGPFTSTGAATLHDSYAVNFVRIAGLPNYSHTVTVTVSSGTYLFQWMGTPVSAATRNGPWVYVGNTIREKVYDVNGSLGAVNLFNSTISNSVANLRADGLNVVLVDVSSRYNEQLLTGVDGLHPSDAGYQVIADSFINHAGQVQPSTSGGALLSTTDGTQAAPAYSFATEPGMGLYRQSTNVLAGAVSNVTGWKFSSGQFDMLIPFYTIGADMYIDTTKGFYSDNFRTRTNPDSGISRGGSANSICSTDGALGSRCFGFFVAAKFCFSNASGIATTVCELLGAGAPAGACTTGSTYHRSDGGASTSLYVCESSAWVAK